MRPGPTYRIVDADTGNSVRLHRFRADNVVEGLYDRIFEHPNRDFKILDEAGSPVPVSRLRSRRSLRVVS